MKSAQKIAKLAAERGTDKPCITALSSKSAIRSRAAKRRWENEKAVTGPKPKTMIRLSRSGYHAVSKECDAIATRVQLYETAWLKGLVALCWQMREDVDNRLYGKPFVSSNPEDQAKAGVIYNDKRLQVAIQTLLPPSTSKDVVQSKQLPSVINTIESEGGGYQTHNPDEDKT